ncbi:MAG: LamG domain-containing protein [Candidatus Moduliflexus flocculans]|nr:LamG domain-containing protein [Candidatus Moduliflexus flocculans]
MAGMPVRRPAAALCLEPYPRRPSIRPPGIKLYLNGKLVGEKAVPGRPSSRPAVDAWIGRNQTPLGLSEEIQVVAPVAFSFDGIIDEVRIYDAALGRAEAEAAPRRGCSRPARRRSGPPVLPLGTQRAGPLRGLLHAAPVRRRMGESLACRRRRRRRRPLRRDAEPAGLLARHELHPRLGHRERHLVHQRVLRDPGRRRWRRAPSPWPTSRPVSRIPGSSRATTPGSSSSGATRRSAVNYDLVNVDPLTGWGDWVEETYTVYPDGTCVRKIKVWSSKPRVDPAEGKEWNNFRQYHEAIIINPPGTAPRGQHRSRTR